MIATEFRTFVQETEKELLALFESIDRNNDNKLSKDELRAAFSTCHCTIVRLHGVAGLDARVRETTANTRLAFRPCRFECAKQQTVCPAKTNAQCSFLTGSSDAFFSEMDVNRDGTISFEEWR